MKTKIKHIALVDLVSTVELLTNSTITEVNGGIQVIVLDTQDERDTVAQKIENCWEKDQEGGSRSDLACIRIDLLAAMSEAINITSFGSWVILVVSKMLDNTALAGRQKLDQTCSQHFA